MVVAKPKIEKQHADLLKERYDLSNRPAQGVTMSRGKPVQEGVRAKLPPGMTWESLAAMSPAEIRDKNLFPNGFYPLPHPNHPEGGMLFPHFEIEEIKKQEARDLTRFDLDFDLPDHFLPEFPAANHAQLPVNRSHAAKVENYGRDGFMRFDGNHGREKNYEPNSFGGPVQSGQPLWAPIEVHGLGGSHAPEHHPEDDDFKQAGDLYRLNSPAEKDRLIANIAATLSRVSREDIVERSIAHFRNADPDYGTRLSKPFANSTNGRERFSKFHRVQ